MGKLLCPKCEQSTLKWLDPDQEDLLENGIMKCQKRLCGAEFVGIQGWRDFKKEKPKGIGLWNAMDAVKEVLGEHGTIGSEHNMVVARDTEGHIKGIGTSFVSCIINTARRHLKSKQKYDMSFAGERY